MKRFALLAAVCCMVTLFAAGDALANSIYIQNLGYPGPCIQPFGMIVYFVSDEGIDREFTVYGVIVHPDGKVYNLKGYRGSEPRLFQDNPAPLKERMPVLARWDLPVLVPVLVVFWNVMRDILPAGGEYRVVLAFFDPNKPITKIEDAFQVCSTSYIMCGN